MCENRRFCPLHPSDNTNMDVSIFLFFLRLAIEQGGRNTHSGRSRRPGRWVIQSVHLQHYLHLYLYLYCVYLAPIVTVKNAICHLINNKKKLYMIHINLSTISPSYTLSHIYPLSKNRDSLQRTHIIILTHG